MLLETIHSPEDLKKLPANQLETLAAELRDELLRVVSQTGGHLSSNLGVVELTIAMHRVFSSPQDSFIFDVGHQSYVHKLLTGRREAFETLRQYGGLSGFPRMEESPHDAFGCGHSSTSISAAVGIATANRLSGRKDYTVAVIGDGAFTGGMAYEALNNCAGNDRLIIILNDNTMSIARNVGAMDTYLNRFRNSAKYFRIKNHVKRMFQRIPLIGKGLVAVSKRIKAWLRHLLVRENLFEHLGLTYYGPLDGNDIPLLETVLREAKQDGRCSVVHVCTRKGKGYPYAEERPDVFHGVGKFDPATGVLAAKSAGTKCYSDIFGETLCALAEQDPTICAITAAMPDGTGLNGFRERFPERFFDVGIAEEHAVTFACGLAAKGYKPVFAVYSTFAQRAYDQLLHDCALQKLPIVLTLDRAGLVGPDGATHHGIFDVAFLGQLPGRFTLYTPDSAEELRECLTRALTLGTPAAVRYPKGGESDYPRERFLPFGDTIDGLSYADFGDAPTAALITYGRLTANVCRAAELLLEKGVHARVIRMVRLLPLDADAISGLSSLLNPVRTVCFYEEGVRAGGVGERLFTLLAEIGPHTAGQTLRLKAIEGEIPLHGSNEKLFEECGFLPEQIAAFVEDLNA